MTATFSNPTEEKINLETYSLIWLDVSLNTSPAKIQAQKQLRTSINHLLTFDNEQICFQYIQSLSKDERIIFIVNKRFGQIILPKIIHFRQIVSIYVWCTNKKASKEWTKQFNKIKSVITDLDELIHRIKTDQHERKHNKMNESLSFSILNSNEQFVQFQFLIDCLIKMKSTKNEKNELISFCKQYYEENSVVLNLINEFQREYSSDEALWWYTRDSFLKQMLNKALRTENIHLLYLFRFFIRDIEQQLEENKCSSSIRVYRSQLMSNDEVQLLKDSLGESISFNSFLSTTSNCRQARSYFSSYDNSTEVERVFFEIEADPQLENIKPFSDINLYSFYPEENEVLFMIGSVFRIINIDRDQDGILIIQMKLCSLNNHHLKSPFQDMQENDNSVETNLLDLGRVLKTMGKLDDAEKYFRRFLNESSDNEKDIANCYRELAYVAKKKGNYDSSLKCHKKTLEIKMRTLEEGDPSIASTHNSMAIIYRLKEDYSRALKSYNKALVIYNEVYGEDHPNVAMCMNNMGIIYEKEHKYSKALELYQKALAIWEKHYPANHRDLGRSHKNIGSIHADLGQYDLSLSHYNLALKIYKKSLPCQHLSIASMQRCIGLVYKHKNDFQQALSYFEKAATIYHHSLSSTHPDVIKIEKDIRCISSKVK